MLPNSHQTKAHLLDPTKKIIYYLELIKLISRIKKTKWAFNILLISGDVLYIFTNCFMKCYIHVVCAMTEIYVCTMHPFSSEHFSFQKMPKHLDRTNSTCLEIWWLLHLFFTNILCMSWIGIYLFLVAKRHKFAEKGDSTHTHLQITWKQPFF